MVTQETEGVSTLPAEEPRENEATDDVAASGPSGEGPRDAVAAQKKNQRWASTLANRSNARHRSIIRDPPPRCMYPKCGNLVEGAGSDS